jgi:orotate phosphoribosyltransferase
MSELDPLRIKLKEHLLEHAVRTGDFVLKSGRKSNWFIDGKQTVCTPEGIQLIAEIILGEIDGIDAFGGLTMGADPVAYGVAAIAADRGQEIRSFSVRKESKDHGVEGRVAGALRKGDRVAITEDVVTRGVSPLEAAEVVRAFGADPVMIISVVDRGGTCEQMAKEAGINFYALLTAPDLGFEYEGP